jgi:hypothetical protein
MRTTGVADVIYVNSVTRTVRCERVRGVKAKGGQLLTDQGKGWMGVCHHEKRSWLSKQVKQGLLGVGLGRYYIICE